MESLSPEQQAVFEAVVDQRSRIPDDYFEYDDQVGQTFLNLKRYSIKYNIGLREQINILDGLARSGILNIEYKTEIISNPDNPELIVYTKHPKFITRRFICLSIGEIHHIQKTYRRTIPAKLKLNKTDHCLIVVTRNKKYYLQQMRADRLPYMVIEYAMIPENQNREIDREELNKNSIPVGDQSIVSRVFEKNDTIKKTLKPFIELGIDTIKIKPSRSLTAQELEIIARNH